MSDAKLEIKLKVAGRRYPMKIDASLEEFYRLSERDINRFMTHYMKDKVDGYNDQDYLALVALQLATANRLLLRNREVGDDEMKRLSALSAEIESLLAKR